MEDKMHRAQMEVSLFSNAIANACDELESRFHSADHTCELNHSRKKFSV
jgi:hypothetical protein